MECCYIVRRNVITTSDLEEFEQNLAQFNNLRDVFIRASIRESISLPRQHALVHYRTKIELFGSPNGTCSSLTESQHKGAVKEPWRCSSHFNALPQMVKTISRLTKLAALRHIFQNRGMLDGTVSEYALALANDNLPAILPYGAHDDENGSEGDSDDDDGGPSSAPQALAQVTLAVTQGPWNVYGKCYDYHSTMLQNEAIQPALTCLPPISGNLNFLLPSDVLSLLSATPITMSSHHLRVSPNSPPKSVYSTWRQPPSMPRATSVALAACTKSRFVQIRHGKGTVGSTQYLLQFQIMILRKARCMACWWHVFTSFSCIMIQSCTENSLARWFIGLHQHRKNLTL